MAQVIVLNGASSAGKTTLGRALQERLAEPFMLLGLDTCFQMAPDRWAGGPEGEFRHDGFAYLDYRRKTATRCSVSATVRSAGA